MGSDLTVTGGALLGTVIGALILVVGIILVMKNVLSGRSKSGLADKYDSGAGLAARNKYPDVNAFKWSNTFFMLALALSLGLIVMAFNWTQFEEQVIIPDDALEFDEELIQEPPRTAEPPPPPPPPPPPVIEEVPEEELDEEEEIEFVDMTVEEETVIQEPPPPVKKAAPPPPPPPPPPAPKEEEIFRVVEDMPRFPGCEGKGLSKDELKKCAEGKMLEFLYKNINYPAIARENGVEGTAVVQFTVEKDGSITDAKLARDPGAGTGQEAVRVIEMMNSKGLNWIPGKQRGRPVRVRFTLPVKFKLQ
ncbi:MAG: energy transducer TonB [Bacteroidota bacterium]